jgi:hypothetical protein
MASENLKVDENNKPVIGLVTDDSSQEIRMGRIDDTTKALKVMVIGGTSGGTVWGSITGLISNQSDLQDALDAKQDFIASGTSEEYIRGDGTLATFPSETTLAWGNITGTLSNQTDLQTALNAKQATGNYITALTGDVTASGPGSVASTIASNAVTTSKILNSNVTLAKIENIADSTFLGNNSGGASAPIALTIAQSKTLLNLSGTNTGDQTITLTGDVTGTGTGSFATAIGAGKVTNTMLLGAIASSKLIGTDIDTVGTVTTGTWNGSVVGVTYGGTGSSTASGARTNLGLAIGTDVQAYNAGLAQIAGLADPNADRILFWDDSTGSYSYLTAGSGLSISGTTLTALGAVTSVSANNGSLTISPTTGNVLAEVNLAHNYVWGGTHEFNSTAQFDGATSFTSTVSFTSLPTSSDTVTASNELTTKEYVDTLAQGLQFKGSVTAATTTTLPANTYNNGTLGVGATLTGNANGALSAQDGITLTVGQTLLVKNEATPANNGPYTLTQVGTGGTPYILTRFTNYDVLLEATQGSFVAVLTGTTQGNTIWAQNSVDVVTMGTSDITFSQLSAPTVFTASLGVKKVGIDFEADLSASGAITLSGNSMQVATDGSSIEISSNALRVKASGITNAMLAGSIADTKLSTITTAGKVSGAAFTSLSSIPSGAGLIPTDNLGTGTANSGTFLAGDQTYKAIDLTGLIVGPGSATDSAVVTWDGVSGQLVKNTDLIYSGSSLAISGAGTFSSGGNTTFTSGGSVSLYASITAATTTSNGYLTEIVGGQGGADSGIGGDITITGGFAPGGIGGSVTLIQGLGNSGEGTINFATFSGGGVQFNLSELSGLYGFTFPDGGGRFAVSNASNAWEVDVKQTFAPGATYSGLNVGSYAGEPSTLSNGDIFYDSSVDKFKVQQNGATATLLTDSDAGGLDTELQYNNNGAFGGITGATYNGSNLDVLDSVFRIKDNVDPTKIAVFQASSISGSTTRTMTIPNLSGTIALTDAVNVWGDGIKQTFNPDGTNAGINVGAHTADPSALSNADIWYNSTSNQLKAQINGSTIVIGPSTGDVVGPGSSTDNAIARFDSTTGKLIQNSGVIISDANAVTGVTALTVDNLNLDLNTLSSTDTNGNIILDPNGTGLIAMRNATGFDALINTTNLTANRTYTAPNATGTLAVSASGNIALSAVGNITFTGTLPVANGGTGQTTMSSTLTKFTQTSSVTVSNTIVDTTVIGTGVGSMVFAANSLTAGKVVRVNIKGVYSRVSGSLGFILKLGVTTLIAYSGFSSTQTDQPFDLTYLITCRTTGVSGTIIPSGFINWYVPSEQSGVVHQMFNTTTAITKNTTLSNTLDVLAGFTIANSGNSITVTQVTVETLN